MLADSRFIYFLTLGVTWWVTNKSQKLLTLHQHMGSRPVFEKVYVAYLFSFLVFFYWFFVFSFVCLYSCVTNVACVSGLPIFDLSLGFL